MPVTYRIANCFDSDSMLDKLIDLVSVAFPSSERRSIHVYYEEHLYDDDEDYAPEFLLAELDGSIIGFAELDITQTCINHGMTDEWIRTNGFVWTIAVLPEFQAQGVYSELLKRSELWAAEKEYTVLQIETEEDKAEFFLNHGYRETARIPYGDINELWFEKEAPRHAYVANKL